MNEQQSKTEAKTLPEGFIEITRNLFGDDGGAELVSALSETDSPVSIRLNPRKRVGEPLYEGMVSVDWNPEGFYLPERPSFTLNPLFHSGVFYVQEAASMIHSWIVSSIGFKDKVKAVDLCAAPGGKTGAVLDGLPEGSVMIANEFVGQRANILRENMAKQGAPEVIVTNSPVEAIGRLCSVFDLMIADVPCSGEGMMRKEEIARSQWSTNLIENCRELQRQILDDALAALKPGGYLIYSTCTFNTAEDEENVRWLVEERGLENVPLNPPGDWGILPSLDPAVNAMRFLPGRTRSEGLFVALLRNPSDADYTCPAFNKRTERKGKGKERDKQRLAFPDLRELKKWIKPVGGIELRASDNGTVCAISAGAADLLSCLQSAGARILSAGVEVAEPKGRDFSPTAALALSSILDRSAFPVVELTEDLALSYLRHEALRLPEDTPKGYVLVTHKEIPLGFVKNIGSRANNLYPAEWRIRNL